MQEASRTIAPAGAPHHEAAVAALLLARADALWALQLQTTLRQLRAAGAVAAAAGAVASSSPPPPPPPPPAQAAPVHNGEQQQPQHQQQST